MKKVILPLFAVLATSVFAQTPQTAVPTSPQPTAQVASSARSIPLGSALNLFIQTHAAGKLEWQKDITLIEDPTQVEPGKFLGKAHGLKALYSYRPVTVADLSPVGKQELYKDPRLIPWLEWFAGKQRLISHVGFEANVEPKAETQLPASVSAKPEPTIVPRELDSVEKKFVYTINEEELVANRSLHLKLEEPITKTDTK